MVQRFYSSLAIMRKQIERYLVETNQPETTKDNPVLLRVILSEQHTQLDFGYAALSIYLKGGWIRISPSTYLQIKGSNKKYKLVEVKNIALAPQESEFTSTSDWCVFSLYFEPIPTADCGFDMIEAEHPSPNDFNYYNIEIRTESKIKILIE
jgi:hypothetical protein